MFSVYLSNRSRIPAARARMPIRIPIPVKLILNSLDNPSKISQIASRSVPNLRVILIIYLPD
jgi:hypothetical protein